MHIFLNSPMGCFGTRLHIESTWCFGTSPHAQNSEIPYIQHYRFGAVIAHHRPGGSGEPPTSRPCVKSRLASPEKVVDGSVIATSLRSLDGSPWA